MTSTPTAQATRPAALYALLAALGIGLAGDLLLRDVNPGINLGLWVALLAAAAHLIAARARANAPDTWLLTAVGFASCLAIRDAEPLRVLNILAVMAAFAMAGITFRAEARRARLRDYFFTGLDAGVQVLAGPIPLMGDVDWGPLKGKETMRRLRPIIAGLVLALPIVLVFGALFANADPAFERAGEFLFNWELGPVFMHLLATGFFGWVAAGLLRTWLVAPLVPRIDIPRVGVGAVPVGMAVGAMVLMFLLFVALQARWLFGGAELVQSATGLTYAEFARRGFFEMVTASVLALPVLYGAEALLAGAAASAVQNLRRLGSVQLVLMGLVMLSALSRMKLYIGAYGLTQDRIVATAILVWLAAVMVWFANTVLRGRSERFTFGAVTAGFAVLAGLNAVNPDALVARVNLERVAVAGQEIDAVYLAKLSTDAAPAIAARYAGLPQAARCAFRSVLAERTLAPVGDWRSWNLSRSRGLPLLREIQYAPGACPAAEPAESKTK